MSFSLVVMAKGAFQMTVNLSLSDQKTPPVRCKDESLNQVCQVVVYNVGDN